MQHDNILKKLNSGLTPSGLDPGHRSKITFDVSYLLYLRYEVYRGYIVFAFTIIMFVCLSVYLFV